MMRRLLAILSLLTAWPAVSQGQSLDEVELPRQTEIFIQLGRTINSRTARTGDKFFGTVTVPVTFNDQIVIPRGSYILGRVVMAERSGRLAGKSKLHIEADTVILPSGVTRKMVSVVSSADGVAGGRELGEKGRIVREGSQAGEVGEGAGKGAATGAAIGVFTGGLSGAAIGAAAGGGAAALISLLKRGKDVVLPKGVTLTILLVQGIRFTKPQPPQGKLLGKDSKREPPR